MTIESIKKFVKSFYYANKPFQTSSMKNHRVGINENVPEQIKTQLKPYLPGFEQLSKKHDFYMSIDTLSNQSAVINGMSDQIVITNEMSGADMARKVYKCVSENMKK